MTYPEALDYLLSRLPMYSRIGAAAYKADLNNIIALCDALGQPQHGFKSIHIAGTNGKGSTSHMLAAILQQQGYKTGLYTSPHISDFRERIRINGQMIQPEFVCQFTTETRTLCDSIEPSFFELTVAMAFRYFTEQRVDIAVIETGLGGKLDSTNIITPEVSVITQIGFDHMNLLGHRLEDIALQKAGIIKPHVPIVIGETRPETRPVFADTAAKAAAPVHWAENQYRIQEGGHTRAYWTLLAESMSDGHRTSYALDLTGHYQKQNLRTVLTTCDVLRTRGFDLPLVAVQDGLRSVRQLTGIRGRWDRVAESPDLILDVAHNPDGIHQIINQLHHQYPEALPHFILGFVNDKDISGILAVLPSRARYYFTQAHIPRALPAPELQRLAAQAGLNGEAYEDINEAIQAARKVAHTQDVIMACGSFFLLSEWEGYKVNTNAPAP